MPDDITSVARRVAQTTRASHSIFSHNDLVALLPILDTVAAGPDADRVERWATVIAHATYGGDHGYDFTRWEDAARAAIALADAARAALTTSSAPPTPATAHDALSAYIARLKAALTEISDMGLDMARCDPMWASRRAHAALARLGAEP